MSYDHNPCIFYEVAICLEPMFNPNGLLSQNVCCCLDQGRTLKDINEGRTFINGLFLS